jgi:hypothetical protein
MKYCIKAFLHDRFLGDIITDRAALPQATDELYAQIYAVSPDTVGLVTWVLDDGSDPSDIKTLAQITERL